MRLRKPKPIRKVLLGGFSKMMTVVRSQLPIWEIVGLTMSE